MRNGARHRRGLVLVFLKPNAKDLAMSRIALLCLGLLVAGTAVAAPKNKNTITLWPETERVIEVHRYATATVRHSDVVSVKGLGEGQLVLTGKRAGTTTLTVTNGTTKLEYRIVVEGPEPLKADE